MGEIDRMVQETISSLVVSLPTVAKLFFFLYVSRHVDVI